jgi:hypothetical protein
MPNHIHILLFVLSNKENVVSANPENPEKNGALRIRENGTSRTPSPTNAALPSFVSTLKRFIHKDCGFALFQRAYHDRIIRDETEYQNKWRYIDENPAKWADDDYFVKK